MHFRAKLRNAHLALTALPLLVRIPVSLLATTPLLQWISQARYLALQEKFESALIALSQEKVTTPAIENMQHIVEKVTTTMMFHLYLLQWTNYMFFVLGAIVVASMWPIFGKWSQPLATNDEQYAAGSSPAPVSSTETHVAVRSHLRSIESNEIPCP